MLLAFLTFDITLKRLRSFIAENLKPVGQTAVNLLAIKVKE